MAVTSNRDKQKEWLHAFFINKKKKMRKNLWSILLAILTISASAIAFTACSDDDNDTGGNNGDNNTEIKGDYTATTKVKTVTLKRGYVDNTKEHVTIYEDFNYKYDLVLYSGDMALVPYKRSNGVWTVKYRSSSLYGSGYFNIDIKDIGKMSSISDVSEKITNFSPEDIHTFPAAQPGHGYAACFLTENGTQYLRLYISNYKLDGEGALESITVQYQLY